MTLRRSLLLAIAGLTAAALLVVAGTAVLGLRAYLLDQTDDQLSGAAQLARTRTAEIAAEPARRPEAVRQFVSVTEYVIEVRSPALGTIRMVGAAKLPTRPLLDQARTDTAEPQTVAGYRLVVVHDAEYTVLVALPLAPVRATVRRLAWTAAITSLLVLALLVAFARALLIRRLRPLNEVAAAAGDLADGHLERRVPDPPHGTNTEVGLLTAAVNGMLSRIQDSLAARERSERRMREFVADASHELRTPVTSIRGYLQLVRSGVVDLRERPDVLRRLEDEATRMGTLVSSLLYLARLDAEPPASRAPVDLAALVRDAVADASAVEPDRPLAAETPDTCLVIGDEDTLRQVMANLLSNVRAHVPPAAAARARLTATPGQVRVEVSDDGPGMTPEAAAHAFDRFWRADTARSHSDGSGLGLAIVAEIINAHGGTAGIEGSTVWFTIPATG